MGNKSSVYLEHCRHGVGETGSETEPSGTTLEKSGGSTGGLRRRGGGSRGSYQGSLKEEQFSGIATIQLISVLAPVLSEFWN